MNYYLHTALPVKVNAYKIVTGNTFTQGAANATTATVTVDGVAIPVVVVANITMAVGDYLTTPMGAKTPVTHMSKANFEARYSID